MQTFPNVILTPHEGFYTAEALTRIASVTMENLSLYEQVRHTAQRPIPSLTGSLILNGRTQDLSIRVCCRLARAASRRATWCFAAWGVRGVWYATMSRTVVHRKGKGAQRS